MTTFWPYVVEALDGTPAFGGGGGDDGPRVFNRASQNASLAPMREPAARPEPTRTAVSPARAPATR